MSSNNPDEMDISTFEHVDKGKGKATDDVMPPAEHDDDSSSSEGEDNDPEAEEEAPDNLEEIDTSNIVGKRTRGKKIDFTKVNVPAEEEEDDEDDDDFNDPEKEENTDVDMQG